MGYPLCQLVYLKTHDLGLPNEGTYLEQNEHADNVEQNTGHDTREKWRQKPGGNCRHKGNLAVNL